MGFPSKIAALCIEPAKLSNCRKCYNSPSVTNNQWKQAGLVVKESFCYIVLMSSYPFVVSLDEGGTDI